MLDSETKKEMRVEKHMLSKVYQVDVEKQIEENAQNMKSKVDEG